MGNLSKYFTGLGHGHRHVTCFLVSSPRESFKMSQRFSAANRQLYKDAKKAIRSFRRAIPPGDMNTKVLFVLKRHTWGLKVVIVVRQKATNVNVPLFKTIFQIWSDSQVWEFDQYLKSLHRLFSPWVGDCSSTECECDSDTP